MGTHPIFESDFDCLTELRNYSLSGRGEFGMDGKRLFVDCNPSKFIIYSSLFLFSIFLSLKLDGIIDWNIWCIFIPLFCWKAIVIFGAIFGVIAWIRHPEARNEGQTEFKAMLIAAIIHTLLLCFELLLCIQIEIHYLGSFSYSWLLTFMPLFVLCPLAVAACIWAYNHERSLEMEAVISSNILLFIFIALKLDEVIHWKWKSVFIPLWVVMCLPGIFALYYVVWALLFIRQPQYTAERKANLTHATIWLLVVIPMIAFEVLLTFRLDGDAKLEFMNIFTPLHVCLFTLMLTSCGRGGNRWWCGMRSDFCTALLRTCPCLTIYGNVYVGDKSDSSTGSDSELALDYRDDLMLRDQKHHDPHYSIIRIDVPD